MNRKFTLAIACDNDAFEGSSGRFEIARILAEAAEQIEHGATRASIRDYNGNVVGSYALEDSE